MFSTTNGHEFTRIWGKKFFTTDGTDIFVDGNWVMRAVPSQGSQRGDRLSSWSAFNAEIAGRQS
jgi:hypothetical protein